MSAVDISSSSSPAVEETVTKSSLEYPLTPAGRLVLQTSAGRAVSQLALELAQELTQLRTAITQLQAHNLESQFHIERLDNCAAATEIGFDRIVACVNTVLQQAEQATEKLQSRTEEVQRTTEDLQVKLQHNTEQLQQIIKAVQQQTEAVQTRTESVQSSTEELQQQTTQNARQIAYLLRWVEHYFRHYEAKATDMQVRLGELEELVKRLEDVEQHAVREEQARAESDDAVKAQIRHAEQAGLAHKEDLAKQLKELKLDTIRATQALPACKEDINRCQADLFSLRQIVMSAQRPPMLTMPQILPTPPFPQQSAHLHQGLAQLEQGLMRVEHMAVQHTTAIGQEQQQLGDDVATLQEDMRAGDHHMQAIREELDIVKAHAQRMHQTSVEERGADLATLGGAELATLARRVDRIERESQESRSSLSTNRRDSGRVPSTSSTAVSLELDQLRDEQYPDGIVSSLRSSGRRSGVKMCE
jgi:hypothetical protein